jgi:hypothetical protein
MRSYSASIRAMWIENPPGGRRTQLIAFTRIRGLLSLRWKEEENVAVSDGEVKDDLAVVELVTAGDMAMKA